MKNYIIGLLVVCQLVLGSYLYKVSKVPALAGFPIEHPLVQGPSGEPPMYLFVFLSRNNCHVCLEAIQVLNELPPPFVVSGIVPGNELKNEAEFRRVTGAAFKLIPFSQNYERFNPYYAPTIFGVSGSGHVLFTLPGVPEQKGYLYNFLMNFYGKSTELLFPLSADGIT